MTDTTVAPTGTDPDPYTTEFLVFEDIELEGLEIAFERPPEGPAPRATKPPAVNWGVKVGALADRPGEYVRLFSYKEADYAEAKKLAQAKVREIDKALRAAFKNEIWDVRKHRIPTDGSWRVYVAFLRDATEAEILERKEKAAALIARGQHAAAAKAAKRAAEGAEEGSTAAVATVATDGEIETLGTVATPDAGGKPKRGK